MMKAWGYDSPYDETVQDYFDEVKEYEGTVSGSFDGIRISCFSRKPSDLLMWSHYGGGLRGFCLGYDEDLLAVERNTLLLEVDYAHRPPIVDEFEYALLQDQIWYYEVACENKLDDAMDAEYRRSYSRIGDILRSAFATKPAEWAYEAECRLILQRQPEGPSLYHYDKRALKCVIVGERAPSDDRLRLEKALEAAELDIPVHTARRSRSSFELDILDSDA